MPATRKKPRKRGPKKKHPNPFWEDFVGTIFGARQTPNREYPPPAEPPPSPMESQMLTEMLREGYKVLAKRYHPDLETGDAEKMTELNRIKAELKF